MNTRTVTYYEFDAFRLNIAERLLMRSDDIVPLSHKLIETLILLVENSGHVLTKDALMESLWPDTFVEESSLTQNICLLRKALAETGSYIETIPKRGYRFIGDVRKVTVSDQTIPELLLHERTTTQLVIEEQVLDGSTEPAIVKADDINIRNRELTVGKWKVYGSLIAAALTIISVVAFVRYRASDNVTTSSLPNSIAVLPFKTLGTQTDQALDGLGVADAVILKLSRLHRARVLPLSSVYRYAQSDRDATSIGRELGVDAVLVGTIQHYDDRARISAVLIRSNDGKAIWSEKFDQRDVGVFALQDQISERILAAIAPNIKERIDPTPTNRLTENGEAYKAYLTGLYFWNFRNKDNLPKAIHYLEDAVRQDEKFAMAHALLADAYYLSSQNAYSALTLSESNQKATNSAARALELDDSIAQAHLVRAGVALNQMKYEEAAENFQRALALDPNYAPAHLRYAYFLFGEGKLDEATAEMKLAAESDPVAPTSHLGLGFVYFMSRDFENSTREIEKALEIQPDRITRLNLVETYIQRHMYKEAENELVHLSETDPYVISARAILAAASGNKEQAYQLLNAIKTFPKSNSIPPYEFGVLCAALGDKDAAFESLEKTYPVRFNKARLRFDPQLDQLRGDDRFANLVNRPLAIAKRIGTP